MAYLQLFQISNDLLRIDQFRDHPLSMNAKFSEKQFLPSRKNCFSVYFAYVLNGYTLSRFFFEIINETSTL